MKHFLLMIPMILLLLTACGSKQTPSAEGLFARWKENSPAD